MRKFFLIAFLLSAPLFNFSCGLFQGNLSDYYPVVLDQPVTLVLPQGQGSMSCEFLESRKGEGMTILIYRESHTFGTTPSATFSGETRFTLELDDKTLTQTKMEIVEKVNNKVFEERQVFIQFPGLSGKAAWTNKLVENTFECTSAFEPLRTRFKLYQDCLVVDEKGKDALGPHHVRVWYAKGVGMVKMTDYLPDGTVNPKGLDLERVDP